MKKWMRRMAVLVLTIAMTVGVSVMAQAGTATYDSISAGDTLKVVTSCGDGVNLRKAPNTTTGTIITAIPQNALVYVLSKNSYFTGWLYVSYGANIGYVAVKDSHDLFFTKMSGEASKYSTTSLNNQQAVVTASSLNVRSTPYVTGTIIGYLVKGQAVDALATTSNGWVYVSYYSGSKLVKGYINSTYVTLKTKTTSKADEATAFEPVYGQVATSKNENDLKVYASPKSNASVAATLDEVEVVYISAKSKNDYWYRVTYYDTDEDDDYEEAYENSTMSSGYVKAGDLYVYRVFEKLKLSSKKLTLSVGQRKTLKVVDKYKFFADVRAMGVTTKFKSRKKSVVKVNKSGSVKGFKKGTAKIDVTVTIGKGAYKTSKTLTCKVTVK